MEVGRYFLYKGRIFLYGFLALLFSFVLSAVAGSQQRDLFVIPLWTQFLLARTLDDFFDYEKDGERLRRGFDREEDGEVGFEKIKKNRARYGIGRRGLLRLCIATGLLYTISNLFIYGGGGLLCLVIVIWLLLEEKIPQLKNGAGAISGIYYLSRLRPLSEFKLQELVFLAGLVLLSLVFGVWKRKRRDDL